MFTLKGGKIIYSNFLVLVSLLCLSAGDQNKEHIVERIVSSNEHKGLPLDSSGTKFTFELPDKERLCFYEDFTDTKKYVLDFYVIRGGNNDVDVVIQNSHKTELYKGYKKHYDTVKFESQPGTYEICFSNEMSTFTHKQVHLSLYPDEQESLAEEAGEKLKPRVETAMESAMENIHQHNGAVENLQSYMESRNRLGYNIASSLNESVMWFSITILCGILITGIGQVYAVRKLFPDNKPVVPKQNIVYSQTPTASLL